MFELDRETMSAMAGVISGEVPAVDFNSYGCYTCTSCMGCTGCAGCTSCAGPTSSRQY